MVDKEPSEIYFKHNFHKVNRNRYYNMIRRCYNPKDKSYKYYGARGIIVCDEWLGLDGYDTFFADMGYPPTPWHTLDRRDNDKGYSPENCRYITQAEQNRNSRHTWSKSFTYKVPKKQPHNGWWPTEYLQSKGIL